MLQLIYGELNWHELRFKLKVFVVLQTKKFTIIKMKEERIAAQTPKIREWKYFD